MASEKIIGIVTDVVKHNDKHNVVTLFSREHGRISFISATGSGRTARMRNARLMSLSVIETEVNMRSSRNLQILGAFTCKEVWRTLYFDPIKSAIVMFISEFLHRYLRDASPEPHLWDYVHESLRKLDGLQVSASNFHIAFLMGMLYFAGIAPDITNYERGDFFDMVAGETVGERPYHKNFLPSDETSQMPLLLRMNIDNQHLFRLTGEMRRRILSRQLQYFSTQLPGLANLRSPAVLAEVFG